MKKRAANLVMAAIILVIAAAGILIVGQIQGWFDSDDGSSAVLTEVRGIVTMERDSVAYSAEADTVLRTGDLITCGTGASATIVLGDDRLALGEHAALAIADPSTGAFRAAVSKGEVFVDTAAPLTLSFDGKDVLFADTVASLSVRSGAQSIGIFAGTIEDVASGQIIEWVGDARAVSELKITSLNDFTINQIRMRNEHKFLCFTSAQLDTLIADREAEMQAQLNQTDPLETVPEETALPTEPATAPEATEAVTEQPSEKPTEKPDAPRPTEGREDPKPTQPVQTEPPVTEPPATEPPVTEQKLTCTISIRCDTILNHMDDLDPAKAGYVPASGVILSSKTVEFTEGETVFDVLKRVCGTYGIQLEYSWTPMYDSYYIEGIHHLYEFDCGSESGWMYKVNGWFPNYGCSSYPLSNGDNIVWCYTCVGLGADVGG